MYVVYLTFFSFLSCFTDVGYGYCISFLEMLENTEGAIKNGQSRETGNIGYTRRKQTKHNTLCVGHHYMQANTKNVNKSWVLLQTTGGYKDEPNTVFMQKS